MTVKIAYILLYFLYTTWEMPLVGSQLAEAAAVITVSEAVSSTGFPIVGDHLAWDFFGWKVTEAGDVNNDGFADVLISVGSMKDSCKELEVIFGGHNVESTSSTLSRGFSISAAAYIYSVSSAGDINNDGFSDIVVGIPDGILGGITYVIYGKQDGLDVDLTNFSSLQGFTITGPAGNFQLGAMVAGGGDFNGDGYDDIVVGMCPSQNGGKEVQSAYVIYGQATSANLQIGSLVSSQGFEITGISSVKDMSLSGDIDGDGLTDLIVAVDVCSWCNQRNNFVLYGSISGYQSVDASHLDRSAGFYIFSYGPVYPFSGAQTFYSVSSGDINGDGISDMIFGCPLYPDGDSWDGEKGVTYVVFRCRKRNISLFGYKYHVFGPRLFNYRNWSC
jgi:hypothetical protein